MNEGSRIRGLGAAAAGLAVLAALLVSGAPAAAPVADPPELKRYIEAGIRDNLALKERELSWEKSRQALREARGMFMPSISIEARYSRAGGGREIVFPVGDLMNPVYSTLNQLLAAGGLPVQDFPTLENEVIPFLREEEHETKLRLVQPIFQPAIWYNHGIKSHLTRSSLAGRQAYERELTEEIRKAYYDYLKTIEVERLLGETRGLLEENLRVSERLLANGMVTEDAVLRAKAELSALRQQAGEAGRGRGNAASYFNFLLNRPLDAAIDMPAGELPVARVEVELQQATSAAESGREELVQLEEAIGAAGKSRAMATAAYLPTMSLVFDYGFQGEEYRFTGEDDYWMGSLIFQWDLFSGLQRDARRDQAELDARIYETRLASAREMIRLEVRDAVDALDVAWRSYEAARDRLESSRSSYEIVEKKYENGMAPQIEYLDARNDLTEAGINLIIARYGYHSSLAHLERVTTIESIDR